MVSKRTTTYTLLIARDGRGIWWTKVPELEGVESSGDILERVIDRTAEHAIVARTDRARYGEDPDLDRETFLLELEFTSLKRLGRVETDDDVWDFGRGFDEFQ